MKIIGYLTLFACMICSTLFARQSWEAKEFYVFAIDAVLVLFNAGIIIFIHHSELRAANRSIPKTKLLLAGDFMVENYDRRYIYKRFFCPVKIKTAYGMEIEVNCLIDTGYTGFLSIDESIERQLGLEKAGTGINTSANSQFNTRIYFGSLSIGKSTFEKVRIEAHAYPDKNDERGIIGMQLISHGNLHIQKQGEEFHYSFKI